MLMWLVFLKKNSRMIYDCACASFIIIFQNYKCISKNLITHWFN